MTVLLVADRWYLGTANSDGKRRARTDRSYSWMYAQECTVCTAYILQRGEYHRYTDPNGTSHPMFISMHAAQIGCRITQVNSGSTTAIDGSGYKMSAPFSVSHHRSASAYGDATDGMSCRILA